MTFDIEILGWVIISYSVIQLILFGAVYFIIRRNKYDLYHELYFQKERKKNEDLESQRKKITEIYITQLEIRKTKQALQEAGASEALESVEKEKIKEIIEKLQEDYNSANLTTLADLESKQGNDEPALEYINKAIELNFEDPELWRLKGMYLNNLGRTSEEQEAKTRYIEFLSNANFRRNLKQKIILREIEFKNLPFYGSFAWKLKSRINVLLGKNGYGKSHLLSIVLAQLQEETASLIELSRINAIVADKSSERSYLRLRIDNGESAKLPEVEELRKKISECVEKKIKIEELLKHTVDAATENENYDRSKMEAERDELSKEIELKYDRLEQLMGRSLFDKTGSIQSLSGKIPVLAIPDLRFINKSGESTPAITDDKAKKLLEYGAYHFINQAPYENTIQNFLNTISNIYYSDSKTFNDEIFQLINRVFKTLSGNEFKWVEIYPTQDNSGNIIKVQTEGNSESLSIQKVSQGTLSVLSIIGLIFHYLSLRYPEVKRSELTGQQAIVFIDEIDAHLHPSWQQKLIGIIRREFPNVQFIITAHSPLIVAGCKEDEVAVMREMRGGDDKSIKGFFVEKIFEDFIGYTTDELYKKIFEIENKDETYLKYISLIPGKSEMEEELKKLEEAGRKGVLSPDKQAKLIELTDDLYYIEKAKLKLESVVDVEKIKTENQMLRMELELEIEKTNSRTQ